MVGKYRGPIILREDVIVPRNYPPRPRKLYPKWRDRWGNPTRQQQVPLEVELAEIRARHEQYREYNRVKNIARRVRLALEKATQNVTTDYCSVDESDD